MLDTKENIEFKTDYNTIERIIINHKKVQTISNFFGMELFSTTKIYEQMVPGKEYIKTILSLFPLDPDLYNISSTSEVKIKRSIHLGYATVEI